MNENSLVRLWFMRAVFVVLSTLVIFAHLVPLQTAPTAGAAPDLVLAMAFGWALRRPDFVPTSLFALVMLFADLMFMRPPGLFAALSLLALEGLKSRASRVRDMPFSVEWFAAAVAITAVIGLSRIIQALFLVQSLALKVALMQIVLTILCYPVVIGVSWLFFGLKKPSLGEVNALGERL
ncbi:rod shape-determining protein MreD [Lentibacter algarum]|uniref:rod shape-determining protein MreD n=1 Tax=Lentibacter algarum TaxID=576131 RepID=UPI001C074A34|nr:rod shape-determining protein MreD [Lentibacter algarum]MBU2980906.1 rod shape-determining protein MreD [Lentibacter algarum]